MNVPLTPLRFLHYAERQYKHRTAVVCSGQRFTYAQLGERVGRLGGALLHPGVKSGVKPGDRVAFLAVNSHRLLEAYYGVLEAGAVLLPLNIRLAAGELSYILNDSGATVLFIDQQFLPVVESFRTELTTVKRFIQMEGAPAAAWLERENYEELLARAEPHRTDIMQVNEDHLAEIFYTSGTSARPKGVMLTHRNVYLHALHACLGGQFLPAPVELHTIPLFHANGWGVTHYLVMLGGKHVMMPHFDPLEVFRLIQAERVNYFKAVPIMATVIVNHPDRGKYDLTSLHRIIIGGAASSPTLIRQVEQAFQCECYSGYGLTETSPVLSMASAKPELGWEGAERWAGQAMAGFAIPGTELHIVDGEDNFLPENGTGFGELVARADGVMKGYWQHPELTSEVMRGGWFHTGDMASISEDGYVRIVDRKKDIIISGGENVSSLEVENTLLAHPAVLEIAVIPVPDEHWGEVPRALVVLRPGAAATEAELIEFSRSQLAHYKCPHTVVFVESLPKNGTGKVLKKDLRRQYAGEMLAR